jgi:hypothetical protein
MLRIVIEAITIRPVDVPERTIHIEMQWSSGVVDERSVPRIRIRRISKEAIALIHALAALGMGDEAMAEKFNEEKLTTGHHGRWTVQAVKRIRLEHTSTRRAPNAHARQPLPDRRPDGRNSVRGAMKWFDVNSDKVRRWIKRGMVEPCAKTSTGAMASGG